eukprot:CAMPEP_0196152366 /NCGR_PEP_ID=MMETSP0910-20130528/35365_1 /TAXON_ID=49265 /ORGANISM="Thalassiosira rotula, Strain GSO102" /LENGTH=59 /DNA_ID=CAMNT_0041415941 /DNA_START=12 /DNA_END=187 /DNA_ORIENTATION=-
MKFSLSTSAALLAALTISATTAFAPTQSVVRTNNANSIPSTTPLFMSEPNDDWAAPKSA